MKIPEKSTLVIVGNFFPFPKVLRKNKYMFYVYMFV